MVRRGEPEHSRERRIGAEVSPVGRHLEYSFDGVLENAAVAPFRYAERRLDLTALTHLGFQGTGPLGDRRFQLFA
jgi:hypothetical protein